MDDRPDRRGAHVARGWLCAGVLAAAAMACADREVPGALLGRWTSSDPRYEGRSLAISRATIEFGTDPVSSQSFVIERVESEPARDGATLHAVHYRDEAGSPRSVRLQLLRGRTPSLRFENHEELWVRKGGAPGQTRGG